MRLLYATLFLLLAVVSLATSLAFFTGGTGFKIAGGCLLLVGFTAVVFAISFWRKGTATEQRVPVAGDPTCHDCGSSVPENQGKWKTLLKSNQGTTAHGFGRGFVCHACLRQWRSNYLLLPGLLILSVPVAITVVVVVKTYVVK